MITKNSVMKFQNLVVNQESLVKSNPKVPRHNKCSQSEKLFQIAMNGLIVNKRFYEAFS